MAFGSLNRRPAARNGSLGRRKKREYDPIDIEKGGTLLNDRGGSQLLREKGHEWRQGGRNGRTAKTRLEMRWGWRSKRGGGVYGECQWRNQTVPLPPMPVPKKNAVEEKNPKIRLKKHPNHEKNEAQGGITSVTPRGPEAQLQKKYASRGILD